MVFRIQLKQEGEVMMIMSVHWLPVVAASIVAMIIGALWYGLFFGEALYVCRWHGYNERRSNSRAQEDPWNGIHLSIPRHFGYGLRIGRVYEKYGDGIF